MPFGHVERGISLKKKQVIKTTLFQLKYIFNHNILKEKYKKNEQECNTQHPAFCRVFDYKSLLAIVTDSLQCVKNVEALFSFGGNTSKRHTSGEHMVCPKSKLNTKIKYSL